MHQPPDGSSPRAGQGAGTALFVPAALALLAGAVPDGAPRHRAIAAWGAAGPVGGIVAVLLGGAFVDVLRWRSVFVVAVPLALVPLAVTWMVVPGDVPTTAGRLNLRSALLGTLSVALLVYGLGEVPHSGVVSIVPAAAMLLGIALLTVFVIRERRDEAPLVPPALLMQSGLRRALLVAFLHGAATNTPIVFHVLFLQQIAGMSPLETGLSFIPCNLAVIIGSAVATRLVERRGFPAAMATGMAVVMAGLLALTAMAIDGSYVRTLLLGLVLWGFGLGLAQVGIVGAATAAAGPAERGIAAGLVTTCAQVGTAVGLGLLVAIAARFGGPEPEQMVAGYRVAFVGGAGLALIGVVTALLNTRHRPPPDHDGLAMAQARR